MTVSTRPEVRPEVRPDALRAGAFELSVDGVVQSHVDLGDPTNLRHDYVRRIANTIDRMKPTGVALTTLHLGGGGLTLARYLQATRPESVQHVVEQDAAVIELVAERLPLAAGTAVTMHPGDAAAVVERMSGALAGAFELIVCDLYVGLTTPGHVRSSAFYAAVARLLAPGGVVAVNVADDDGLPALQEQLAVLSAVFPTVTVLGPTEVLTRRRAGNAVVLVSPEASLGALVAGLRADGPHPGAVLSADDGDLEQLRGGQRPPGLRPPSGRYTATDAHPDPATPTREDGAPCAADSP